MIKQSGSWAIAALTLLAGASVAGAVGVSWHSEATSHGVIQPGKYAKVRLPDGTVVELQDHGRYEWWDRKVKRGKVEVDLQEVAAVLSGGTIVPAASPGSTYSLTCVDHQTGQSTTGTAPISGTFDAVINLDGSYYQWNMTLGGFMSQPFLYVGYQGASLGNFSFLPAPTPQGQPAPYLNFVLDPQTVSGTYTMREYLYLHADNLWLEDSYGQRSDMIMMVEHAGVFEPEPSMITLLASGGLAMLRKRRTSRA